MKKWQSESEWESKINENKDLRDDDLIVMCQIVCMSYPLPTCIRTPPISSLIEFCVCACAENSIFYRENCVIVSSMCADVCRWKEDPIGFSFVPILMLSASLVYTEFLMHCSSSVVVKTMNQSLLLFFFFFAWSLIRINISFQTFSCFSSISM